MLARFVQVLDSHVSCNAVRPSRTSFLSCGFASFPYRRSLKAPTVCCIDSVKVASSSWRRSISASKATVAPSSSGKIDSRVCSDFLAPDSSANNLDVYVSVYTTHNRRLLGDTYSPFYLDLAVDFFLVCLSLLLEDLPPHGLATLGLYLD